MDRDVQPYGIYCMDVFKRSGYFQCRSDRIGQLVGPVHDAECGQLGDLVGSCQHSRNVRLSHRGGRFAVDKPRLRPGRESGAQWLLRCRRYNHAVVGSRCMPISTASQPTSTFTSWKEIAAYLGKGVRTVQRWECDLGLPILRPNGKPSGVVLASPAELDRWRARHWSRGKNWSRGTKSHGSVAMVSHQTVTVAWENIRASRELRNQSQHLVQQLTQSTQTLTQACLRLTLRLKDVV